MQFQVPQFIEHEPKIVGPLTFQQFIYIGIAGAAGFFIYFFLPFSLFIILTLIMVTAGAALAFIRVGGKSLPSLLFNLLTFSIGPKTYIWKRGRPLEIFEKKEHVQKKMPVVVGMTRGKSRKIDNLSMRIETKS